MLVSAFLESCERFPGKLAVADHAARLTYAQLRRITRVLCRAIDSRTQLPRVGLMLPGSAGGLASLFAALWADKIAIPLNFLLNPSELKKVVEDADIDLILSTVHLRETVDQLPAQACYLEELRLKRKFLFEMLRGAPPVPRHDADDVAFTLYTSGTTGLPKGVQLSHDNIYSNAKAAWERLQLDSNVHLLGIIPSFHVFGLTVLHVLPMLLGGSITFIPRFSPQAAHRVIQQKQVNVLLGVPSMYGAIARLKSVKPEDFDQVRIAASGGEPLPATIHDLFRKRTGITLIEGYGMTETSPIISADLPDQPHPGTVGKPLPDVEIQLRDDSGNVVEKEGELFVRGPLVMKGYYKREQETREVIDEQGWFRTGDIVRLEDGYIRITGRAKDLIIVGGDNVYPREVEQVLESHPDVAEAAVIGRADASRGEVVVAYVTAEDGTNLDADALRAHCREHLAGFKVPREIHVREEMPRGPTGKILKRELREELSGS